MGVEGSTREDDPGDDDEVVQGVMIEEGKEGF